MPDDTAVQMKNLASNEPLTRLKALRAERERLEAALGAYLDAVELEQVRAAQARGHSWRDIARAIGVRESTAHGRYAKWL